jgi:hypothetical protein
VTYYFEILVYRITGLNKVINRAFKALDLITTDPEKNTVAERNNSWSVDKPSEAA